MYVYKYIAGKYASQVVCTFIRIFMVDCNPSLKSRL